VSGVSYLAPGTLFAGRFEIGQELGRGGVSVVYAARDQHVGQDVALKLLVPSPASANQARERMRREVHAVRRLAHPNIVAVFDFVEDGPYGAVIMELVDGEDLDRRVRRSGALSADEVTRIGIDVAAALTVAHRHGILHRDVKPQNILIEKGGRARLTDFGSARMDGDTTITRTGAMVGTLAYMAPEAVAGRRGDARSDVFALGMTLFHAAAGRLPDRPSPHLPVPASPTGYSPLVLAADVPTWLAHSIARATSADPGDRYPTPAAMADALGSEDTRKAAGLAAISRDRCVLCGAIDVLDTAVCPSCASGVRSADALVVLVPPQAPTERDRQLDALAGLLGDDVDSGTLAAVASGTRSLMRVPVGSRDRVIDALARRGLRGRVFVERELWRALPDGYRLLVGTVLVAGMIAGVVAAPILAVTTIPFAMLLVAGGLVSLRRPALATERRTSALPEPVRTRIIETFGELAPGPTRSLLADVVRRGTGVRRALALRQDTTATAETVDDLLVAACASARDLAALDESLGQFDRERARGDGDGRWLDGLVDCERTRDAAVQRLLDAVTVLGQLDVQAIRATDDVRGRLEEVIAELDSDVRARVAARDELGTLLA
jgi:hypothetical protein